MAELRGRAAIVTGGTRGIGRAVSDALAAEGALLALCYRENDEAAVATRSELERHGAAVELVRADVAEPNAARTIVQRTLDRFGRVDCLVNNAGINRDAALRKLEREAYEAVIGVNFLGAALLAQAAIVPMIEAGFGRIVNVSSFVAHKGVRGAANYVASKAALMGWTKAAALEWARYGITVNVVSPGYVETDMLRTIPSDVLDGLHAQIPLGRFGRPEEIAEAIIFALRADYMTGAEIDVNGGIYM